MKVLCVLMLAAVTFGCGYGSSYNGSNPALGTTPAIMQLSPASTMAGGAGFVLTINGSNFPVGSTVYWGSMPHTANYVTGNQITTVISPADIADPSTISVHVQANGRESNTTTFTVE